MTTTQKTWAQALQDIYDTMRKWHGVSYSSVEVISPYMNMKAADRRKLDRAGLSAQDRAVTLKFEWYPEDARRMRVLMFTVGREPTALANLTVLAKMIEHIRVADVRGLTSPIVKAYRLLYPEFAERQSSTSDAHYATLHVTPDAPLAVCESAFRALIRTHHPDVGGTHERAKRLNEAINWIREQHTRPRQENGA